MLKNVNYEVEILHQNYIFDNEQDAEDFYFELKALQRGFNVLIYKTDKVGEEF